MEGGYRVHHLVTDKQPSSPDRAYVVLRHLRDTHKVHLRPRWIAVHGPRNECGHLPDRDVLLARDVQYLPVHDTTRPRHRQHSGRYIGSERPRHFVVGPVRLWSTGPVAGPHPLLCVCVNACAW